MSALEWDIPMPQTGFAHEPEAGAPEPRPAPRLRRTQATRLLAQKRPARDGEPR
jgi:hypothetical protein